VASPAICPGEYLGPGHLESQAKSQITVQYLRIHTWRVDSSTASSKSFSICSMSSTVSLSRASEKPPAYRTKEACDGKTPSVQVCVLVHTYVCIVSKQSTVLFSKYSEDLPFY
jgi:hypothetical protein